MTVSRIPLLSKSNFEKHLICIENQEKRYVLALSRHLGYRHSKTAETWNNKSLWNCHKIREETNITQLERSWEKLSLEASCTNPDAIARLATPCITWKGFPPVLKNSMDAVNHQMLAAFFLWLLHSFQPNFEWSFPPGSSSSTMEICGSGHRAFGLNFPLFPSNFKRDVWLLLDHFFYKDMPYWFIALGFCCFWIYCV